jgi:hypothetical protein
MRSGYNGSGASNSGPGPIQLLIDGTTLAPDHWWKLT